MATVYGDYLRDRYPEMKTADADVPVSVELVGAIDKKVVRFGLPVNAVVPVTTFDQAKAIITDLKDVKNLSVRMTGWCNGGVSQKVLTKVKTVGSLGGDGGMRSLIKAAAEMDVPLYFDGLTCFAYRSGLTNGFVAYRDAARFTTREQIIIYPYSPIIYQQDDYYDRLF